MNYVIIPYITPFDYIRSFICNVEHFHRFRKLTRWLCPLSPITKPGQPYIWGRKSISLSVASL